jgi:stage II sporulation protein R
MKKLFLPLITLLISTLFLACIPTNADYSIYADTVRLHILANSDSNEDQELKLIVRDEILKKYSSELSVFENIDTAKDTLKAKLSDIERTASEIIQKNGYDYTVKATLTEEWYDTREYEGFSLPKGSYTSLQIKIGEAEGKNWWCVMFPPMCLDAATEEVKYTHSEEILIKRKYSVKFKLLELVSALSR